ncbi:MarR family transcriptional regulator [Burkholderia sp. Nafp2/4-1b]|uniref:MarR family transcriptional regulator n=1 Tax=Burkholderia sp. Nafp2/4-1b TaxID=2116686 RepID=UPI001969D1E9|nr:MarR family transcriptional regulator [Burkholderia sp. Nafp2/4-1b]
MPTQQQIAAHLDLDQSTVSRLVARLALDYRSASMDDVRVAYIRHLREVAASHTSADGLDLTAERAKTEVVDREIKLLTLAEKNGQLVNAAQLEQAYGQMVGAFQAELLALPDKLVQELRTLYGVEVDVQWLNEHVYGCLEQLSRYDADGAGGHSPDCTTTAPARADRHDGVGQALPQDECEGLGEPGAL